MDWQSTDTTNTEQMRQDSAEAGHGSGFWATQTTRESGMAHISKRRHMRALPMRSLTRWSETCISGRVSRTKKSCSVRGLPERLLFRRCFALWWLPNNLTVRQVSDSNKLGHCSDCWRMALVSRVPWLGYFAVDSPDLVRWLVAQFKFRTLVFIQVCTFWTSLGSTLANCNHCFNCPYKMGYGLSLI